ncbi:MAG: hypothetical protein P8J44_06185, partial [Gammaproteobacteria bacterium]|nr:hypothetical protein [Gammaproteobacteria bacterium]
MKMSLFWVMLVLSGFAGSANAQIGCDRACLSGFMDSYLNALYANNPAAVPVANDVKITDNNRIVNLNQAFWNEAQETAYRWDIANPRLGDVATEAVVRNSDGSYTMVMVRLKVASNAITEVEVIRANQGDADRLWGPERLVDYPLSTNLDNS